MGEFDQFTSSLLEEAKAFWEEGGEPFWPRGTERLSARFYFGRLFGAGSTHQRYRGTLRTWRPISA
jgi:hypothetical protein